MPFFSDHALNGLLLVAKVKAQAGFSIYLATVDWPSLIFRNVSKELELIIILAYDILRKI